MPGAFDMRSTIRNQTRSRWTRLKKLKIRVETESLKTLRHAADFSWELFLEETKCLGNAKRQKNVGVPRSWNGKDPLNP